MNFNDVKQLEQQAGAYLQNANESFERCDTDGFVSQWAAGINSDVCRAKARIASKGGLDVFTGLYSGNTRVRAKIVDGRFGAVWLIDECDQRLTGGRTFIPAGARSKVQLALGLSERAELAPANVCTAGSGRGLAGATSVRVVSFRTGCKWGSDAVPV